MIIAGNSKIGGQVTTVDVLPDGDYLLESATVRAGYIPGSEYCSVTFFLQRRSSTLPAPGFVSLNLGSASVNASARRETNHFAPPRPIKFTIDSSGQDPERSAFTIALGTDGQCSYGLHVLVTPQ